MQKPDGTITPDRHLKVTPLDLRQTRFRAAIRGFDRDEVAAFLLEAADDYENALRENERLRIELVKLDAMLTQHRELEGSLRTTLVSAQKVADDMRETATQEAARIVREAEARAELLTQKAHSRLEDVHREIDSLKLKRLEAEAHMDAMIGSLQSALDHVREQDQRDERVLVHRPREVGMPA